MKTAHARRKLAQLALTLSLATLAACNLTGDGPGAAETAFPPPPVGIAPQPYSAEQIRASNPAGTICEYYITQAGMSPIRQTFEWSMSGATGCKMTTTMVNAGGGSPASESSTATWHELRDHASFPLALTVRTEETIRTPAGQFACWRYDVRKPDETGQLMVEKYWFDKATAGSPVMVLVEKGRAEVMRMELTSTNRVTF